MEIEKAAQSVYYSTEIKARVKHTQDEIKRLLWELHSDLSGFNLEVEQGNADRNYTCKITVKL
jgi:hypothetical protein